MEKDLFRSVSSAKKGIIKLIEKDILNSNLQIQFNKNSPDGDEGKVTINNKTARVAITSGNLEPVPDSLGNSKHSPFAKSLIDILDDNEEIMLSSALFVKLETYLTNYSNFQETLYSPLSVPEHKYGGHFIFVPTE